MTYRRLPAVLGSLMSIGCAAARPATEPARLPISAPLQTARSTFRLVPLGRSEADTTEWTTEYHRDGSTRVLQVMLANVRGRHSVDSVLFDSTTLRPVWERTHTAEMSAAITFDSGYVRAEIRRGSNPAQSTQLPLSTAMFASTMDDIVVSHLPFAVDAQTVLRFWSGTRFETDTVKIAAYEPRSTTASVGTWTVQLFEPGTIETLWIDEPSRLISRHRYTRRSDGAESEVIRLAPRLQ